MKIAWFNNNIEIITKWSIVFAILSFSASFISIAVSGASFNYRVAKIEERVSVVEEIKARIDVLSYAIERQQFLIDNPEEKN